MPEASHSYAACSAHQVCDASKNQWANPLAAVDAVTDRICISHSVCDSISTSNTDQAGVTTATQYRSVAGTSTADSICVALTECDASAEYESVAPTVETNRGCATISPECKVGASFEKSEPTPFADRVCQSVDICIQNTASGGSGTTYPGFYMESKPTAKTDTVCTALKECEYESQEIVHPATVDTSTFAYDVYSVDRTCADRVSCVDVFEATEKDAFSTTCVEVAHTAYVIDFPTTTCATLFADSMDNNNKWELFLAGKSGTTGYDTADWINNSLEAKVKGTGSTYTEQMESFATNEGAGCKVTVPVFFLAANFRQRNRFARSADGRTRRETFPESSEPVVYEEGGKPCSNDGAALCCEKGYGGNGTSCIACGVMTYTDAETAAAAQEGCMAQPECDVNSEYYLNPEPSTQSIVANNCQQRSSCAQLGVLSEELVPGQDRECTLTAIVLCDSTTQYWSNSADEQFVGTYEWTESPTCLSMTECPTTDWWTNSDATVGVPVASDGVAVMQFYTEDRVCEVRSCETGEYIENIVSVEAEGTNSKVDFECQEWQVCEATTAYTVRNGTAETDTVCAAVDLCDSTTEWASVPSTPTSNTFCADLTECTSEQWEEVSASSTSDRKCTELTACTADEQFQDISSVSEGSVNVPKRRRDESIANAPPYRCTNLTVCKENEAVRVNHTLTTDRTCYVTSYKDCRGWPLDNFEPTPKAAKPTGQTPFSETDCDSPNECAGLCNENGDNCNYFAYDADGKICYQYTDATTASNMVNVQDHVYYTRAANCPAPFSWGTEHGCCAEEEFGKLARSEFYETLRLTNISMADALKNCTATCAADERCNAVQTRQIRQRGHAKCYFFASSTIRAGSVATPRCRKSKCMYKMPYIVPTSPAPTPAPTPSPTPVPTPQGIESIFYESTYESINFDPVGETFSGSGQQGFSGLSGFKGDRTDDAAKEAHLNKVDFQEKVGTCCEPENPDKDLISIFTAEDLKTILEKTSPSSGSRDEINEMCEELCRTEGSIAGSVAGQSSLFRTENPCEGFEINYGFLARKTSSTGFLEKAAGYTCKLFRSVLNWKPHGKSKLLLEKDRLKHHRLQKKRGLASKKCKRASCTVKNTQYEIRNTFDLDFDVCNPTYYLLVAYAITVDPCGTNVFYNPLTKSYDQDSTLEARGSCEQREYVYPRRNERYVHYKCTCKNGFSGKNCKTPPEVPQE